MSTIPVGCVTPYGQARVDQMQAYAALIGVQQSASTTAACSSKETTMLEKLRNLADTLNIAGAVDALIELAAYGRSLANEYTAQGLPEPKWLSRNLKLLTQEIKARWRAEREAELRKAEAELEELRSREEKRAAKEEEIARLREELGG